MTLCWLARQAWASQTGFTVCSVPNAEMSELVLKRKSKEKGVSKPFSSMGAAGTCHRENRDAEMVRAFICERDTSELNSLIYLALDMDSKSLKPLAQLLFYFLDKCL